MEKDIGATYSMIHCARGEMIPHFTTHFTGEVVMDGDDRCEQHPITGSDTLESVVRLFVRVSGDRPFPAAQATHTCEQFEPHQRTVERGDPRLRQLTVKSIADC